MNLKQILVLVCIFVYLSVPAMAAPTGEEGVKIIPKNGTSTTDGIQKVDSNKDSSKSDDLDIWGIQNSDMDFSDIADIGVMGRVYTGITPLRNASFISVSISGGLAITAVIVGIFLVVLVAGYGMGHPNIKKGWEYLHGAQGKLVAIGGIFVLALFMITIVFFSLYIFSQINFSL